MKNSLFKRALATVAAVPLALTQSLTYSFAADTDTAPETASVSEAETTGSSKNYNLESLLYIKPAKTDTESEWNLTLDGVLDQLVQDGQTSGSILTSNLYNIVASKAGQNKDVAKAVLAQISNEKYEIKDGDIVITAEVGEVAKALGADFQNSFGSLSKKIAEKYNDPDLSKIDFGKVKTAGTVKVVIGTSQLSVETKIPVTFTFTPAETGEDLGPAATLAYVDSKLDEVKAVVNAAIDDSSASDKAAAKKDVDKEIGRYKDYVKRANNALNKSMAYKKSANYSSFSGFLTEVNEWTKKKFNRTIPTTGTALGEAPAFVSIFNDAIAQLNNAVEPAAFNISANELGTFADENLSQIVLNGDGAGTTVFEAKLPDAEADQVKALFEEDPTTDYEDSYKTIKVTIDTTKLDDEGFSVDINVKRTVVTKAKTTTTSTTSTTTTTDTTTTSTDTDTSTTSTDTDTTTSSTTTTTTTSTTTSTTTTYAYTTELQSVFAEIDATYGFYTNLDEEFSTKQVNGLEIHTVYNDIQIDEEGNRTTAGQHAGSVVDAKMAFGFGEKTPANTFDPTVSNFKYEIPVIYTGEDILADDGTTVLIKKGDTLKKADGTDVTVTAYIGVKGDANLDGKLSAVDASYVLIFAADLQEMNEDGSVRDPQTVVLSKQSALVANDPAGIYDNFAAFLADVKNEINPLHAWKTGKGSIADGTSRAFNPVDASYILVANANIQEGDSVAEAWNKLLNK